MIPQLPAPALLLFEAGTRGHVKLATDNRFDPRLASPGVEIERAEHIPMVGEPHRRAAVLECGLDQIRQPAGAVEQAVVAMDVEVDE